jgi:hypothetical protein
MSRVTKILLAGQVLLFVAIAICTILMPQFFFSTDQGGMSNYGLHARTSPFFIVGFAGCAFLTCLAALSLPRAIPHYSELRVSLLIVGVLGLLMAVTTFTYKLNPMLNVLHVRGAQFLALLEAVISTWYVRRLVKDHINRIAYGVLLIGLVVGIFTVLGALHLLFTAEFLASLGFGIVAVHTVDALTSQKD